MVRRAFSEGVQDMPSDTGDLKYVKDTVALLKKERPDKLILRLDKKTEPLEITLDTSAFIRNKKDTKRSDERYVNLFENLIYRALKYSYQKTISDHLRSFEAFLEFGEVEPVRDHRTDVQNIITHC